MPDFSIQHFGSPLLRQLLTNATKNAQNSDGAEQITYLNEFHVAFNKMEGVARRAHPLDYSYEPIRGFLGYQNYFEGPEHLQDRQGMQPAVLCVKVVDTVVYDNRMAFTKEGNFGDFATMDHLIKSKDRLLERIYKAMGIQKKLIVPKQQNRNTSADKAGGGGGGSGSSGVATTPQSNQSG